MDIRIAKNENDSKSASYIYAMSWKSAYKNIFSEHLLNEISSDFWVDSFNSNYNTKRFEIAILSVNNKDLGAGGYGLSRDYPEKEWGEITSIYFLEKDWGKGYSSEIMQFMIDKLRDMGCSKIHIWVLAENIRAQEFYEKFGFKRSGAIKEITFKGETKIDVEFIL